MKYFIGVDPGLSGAYSVIDGKGALCLARRAPVLVTTDCSGKKTRIMDCVKVKNDLKHIDVREAVVLLEKVTTFPRDGRLGAFRFGMNYGMWKGLLSCMGFSVHEYPPKIWQKEMLDKGGLSDTKVKACRKALELHDDDPLVTKLLKVKANQGIADALLMAELGRRRFT